MAAPEAAENLSHSSFDDDYFTDSADEWDRPLGGGGGNGRGDADAINGNGGSGPAPTAAATAAAATAAAAAGLKVPEHMAAMERELLGEAVPITFHLPTGGGTLSGTFYMGQTVEALKMFLESQRPNRELAYDKTALYLGEKMLFDPLSLNDLPFRGGVNNDVKVTVG